MNNAGSTAACEEALPAARDGRVGFAGSAGSGDEISGIAGKAGAPMENDGALAVACEFKAGSRRTVSWLAEVAIADASVGVLGELTGLIAGVCWANCMAEWTTELTPPWREGFALAWNVERISVWAEAVASG